MKWEWKGRKLAPIHMIALRLLLWPALMAAKCVAAAAVWIGWGKADAVRLWRYWE